MDETIIEEKRNRVKYAFINYKDIQTKIDNGDIDEYDIVFTKDTHEQYLIKDDLSLLNIKSRIYCFNSIVSAKEALNSNTDTYEGQIVAIADNDFGVYHGYIVNRVGEEYTVTSLADSGNSIDYDTLAHRPICNKTGTLANPLIIGNLDNGLYSVSGEYKLFDEYPTIFSSSINHLFLVEKSETESYIKDISAKEIITYKLINGEVSKSELLTQQYLEDNHYITENDFDAKIAILEYITKAEASEYVKQIITEYLDGNLGNIIDTKIDEKISTLIVEDTEIEHLFK